MAATGPQRGVVMAAAFFAGAGILELLGELNRGRGVTILLATHSAEAAASARHVIHLRDGTIAVGP